MLGLLICCGFIFYGFKKLDKKKKLTWIYDWPW
jgi:hypothetical protein